MRKTRGFTGTSAVRAAHRFDEARLARWLEANVAGYAGPLSVEQFRGGQSNPTYKLVTPRRNYVLRRKPPGKLLKGAHAVEREARVLAALAQVDFPVAQVHGLCLDEGVIGTRFYVMDCVDGRIFWDATLPEVARGERRRLFASMNETLARLHLVDVGAVGLADYGRPGNYFERQIARWSGQYRGDVEAGREAHLDRLVEWLPAHIPPGDETRLVHGDYRIDNLVFHPAEPRVLAVLDWELSTLGHPLADFAYHLMMYRMPRGISAGLLGENLESLGIPAEEEYVTAYCRRTGRDGLPGLDFYVAFNMFRRACILHGIKARLARGTAASAHAAEMVRALPVIAELAWRQASAAQG